jgi:VWFA-related protein
MKHSSHWPISLQKIWSALTLAAILLLLSLTLNLWPSTAAQQQTRQTEQEPLIKINTNLVQVDAVVKDERGEIITDLKAEDFEIIEQGRARPVEYCSYIPLTVERPAPTVAADARLAKNELGRTIVFLVSNPTIDFTTVNTAIGPSSTRITANDLRMRATGNPNASEVSRDAHLVSRLLRQFVEQQMGPRDLAAMLNVDRDLGVLSRLTNNREVLQAASDEIARQAEEAPRQSVSLVINNSGPRLASKALVNQNLATLEMLGERIEQTRHLPGRKLIVLVGRGFLFSPNLDGSDKVRARLRELTAQANQARIAIYALHPGGVGSRGGGLQDLDSMVALANETGGRAIYNTNDIGFGFAEILKENQGYYLLGYDPGEEKAKADHKIKVRVKRPGLQAQARAVAYANKTARSTAAAPGAIGERDETAERASLAAALSTPFALRDIGVSVTPLFLSPDGRQSNILSFLNIDLAGIAAEARAGGVNAVTLELALHIIGPDGKLIKEEANGYHYTLTPTEFDRLKRQGVSYGFSFTPPLPGYYQVNAAVRDPRSGRVGNASRLVKVADLARQTLSLSSLALSPAGKRLLPLKSARPGAEIFTPPQSYMRGEKLRYQCYVYHARQDAAQSSRLQTQVTIKRGAEIVVRAEPRLITQRGEVAPLLEGEFALAGLAPGAYTLELIVEDLLQKNAKLTASTPLAIR